MPVPCHHFGRNNAPRHRATPASAAAAASRARILRRTSVVISTRPPRCGDPLRREPQVTSTLVRRAVSSTLVALILALALPAVPAAAMTGTVTGKVVDSVTMQGIFDAHIYLGIPGGFIWAHSAVDGSFTIDLTPIQYNPSTPWQVYFVKSGYVTTPTNKFFLTSSGYVFGSDPANVPNPFPLVKQLVGPRSRCADAGPGNRNPPALPC